jgi:hypothetical protein
MVILLTGISFVFAVPHMWADEVYPDYHSVILPYVMSCDPGQVFMQGDYIHRNVLKYQLHCMSWHYLESPNALLIPFNLMVPLLTYFVATAITKDRLIGLISFAAIGLNPLYMDWRYSGTYDMVWTFFILLSVYLLVKKHDFTPMLSMAVAIAAKSVALMYLPMWLITARKRKRVLGIVGGILIVGAVIAISDPTSARVLVGNEIGFFPENFEDALGSNLSVLWPVLPALLALLGINSVFRSKDKPPGKKLVLGWLLITIIGTALVHMFTMQQTYGYRLGVFAAFMSIYAGMVVVEAGNFIVNRK